MTAPFALGRLPRVEFGAGRFETVPDLVAGYGRRVLLVVGGASFASSPRRAWLERALTDRGVAVAGTVSVIGEPAPGEVDGAVADHRGASADVVLGIGGGSVLDAAKAVAGLLRSGTSVRDHLEGVWPGLPYPGPTVPFVAVPTTAGTGSEVTRNAVLTERGEAGFKRSFRDERLVAVAAVVDPDLLAGAPPTLIAANGADALTQLLEAYVSLRASPLTDALALSGLEATRDGLLPWHADPAGAGAAPARSLMAYAALLSGICLANAGLGAVHGLASPVGALFPVPHGAACGGLLAATVEVNLAALRVRDPGSPALARYARAGRLLAGLRAGTTDDVAADALASLLRAWTRSLGIPGLAAFGLTRADIASIVADARGSSMRSNPIVLTDEEIGGIVERSL